MPVAICWSLDDITNELVRLEVEGPLPQRVVVVPHQRMAHALRRSLVEHGKTDVLAGTRFLSCAALAEEMLRSAGRAFQLGEERLRPARLRHLFASGPELTHFDRELLTSRRGWEHAFARTIHDLEAAGVSPSMLRLANDPRCDDVATLWEAASVVAGDSWTRSRVVAEAAQWLSTEAPANARASQVAVLAMASSRTTLSEARLMRRVPNCKIALVAARPLRPAFEEHIEELFGRDALEALLASAPASHHATDLDVLKSRLFDPTDSVDTSSPTESQRTVHLEEHAGVDEELDAAVTWVARQVIEHRRPLSRIAVLVPHLDPLATMLHDRLQTLQIDGAPMTIFVAGGVPISSTPAGARLNTVLRALSRFVGADDLAEVLPVLRPKEGYRRLTKGTALELAYSLGTVGGSVGHPRGALAWTANIAARLTATRSELAAASAEAELDAERTGLARSIDEMKRLIASMESAEESITALCAAAQTIVEGQPLPVIWAAIRDFVSEHLVLHEGQRLVAMMEQALQPALADRTCGDLKGLDALDVVRDTLLSLRQSTARFGEPAIYVGTLAGALGLPFDAVRIVGLSEGSIPSHPRQDAVLPDAARLVLARSVLPITADRALASLHALDIAVRNARDTLAMSAPRRTLENTYREPSSVFLDACAALRRTDSASYSLRHLRRTEFRPANRERVSFRLENPITHADWLALAAAKHELPPWWCDASSIDVERVMGVSYDTLDGLLDATLPIPTLPGLTEDRPLSASRLRSLLLCPHQFLLESVLGWRAPPEPRPQRELDRLAYGSLLHKVAERFYAAHGTEFARRKESLPIWQGHADEIADEEFARLMIQYPLASEATRRQERERLRREVSDYLYFEWSDRPKRRFVATERAFGMDKPVRIDTAEGPLWMHGFVDLLEVEDGTTMVRDLKTAQCKPRAGKEVDPHPTLDIQLAVYAAAVRRLAKAWGVPSKVGVAYVHTNDRKGRERAFVDDFESLEAAAEGWFGTAHALLEQRQFPRTPIEDDCTFCPFKPLCGLDARDRAHDALAGAEEGPLPHFLELKG